MSFLIAGAGCGCELYAKCEFLNPGQSVKDRAALYIMLDAIARGALRPGGVIVVNTVLLGNLAVWSGEKVEWDAENLKAKGKPELDAIIRPKYREGYTL